MLVRDLLNACAFTLSSYGNLADDALEALAKEGDVSAFEVLLTRAYDRCLALAFSVLRDPDDASDEVQNAFWRAYKHLDSFKQQSRFTTWVGQIVINRCLTRLRDGRRWKTIVYDSTTDRITCVSTAVRLGADRDDPERLLARKELNALVRREVGRLPLLLRQPVEYHHFEGLTLDEVAVRLGISLAATKSRLNRAHACLRKRMSRHCGGRGPSTLLEAA